MCDAMCIALVTRITISSASSLYRYYAGTIVTMAGWTDVSDAIWITAGFSFIGFLANIAGMLQVGLTSPV